MISACITDPFAGWLRIKDSRLDAFTLPRNGAQAAGCTEPQLKLLPTGDTCQLMDASLRAGERSGRARRVRLYLRAVSEQQHYDTLVAVETTVYSLDRNELLWSSTSRTRNPQDLNTLVNEVADATAKEMLRQGLLAHR